MTQRDENTVLMMRVKRGDREAFRELVEKHKAVVYNMINRAISDSWEAEDLAQRVFIQVFRSAHRYKPKAKFTTWLFSIVRNTIINEYRRKSRHPLHSLEAIEQPNREDQVGRELPDQLILNPSDQAMHRELHEHIQQALTNLPEQQRMAVILRRYEGQSYKEIALIMKCSVTSVKSLLHRARISLKESLKGYY